MKRLLKNNRFHYSGMYDYVSEDEFKLKLETLIKAKKESMKERHRLSNNPLISLYFYIVIKLMVSKYILSYKLNSLW